MTGRQSASHDFDVLARQGCRSGSAPSMRPADTPESRDALSVYWSAIANTGATGERA